MPTDLKMYDWIVYLLCPLISKFNTGLYIFAMPFKLSLDYVFAMPTYLKI
jgi:hypothetical protein